jgi:hypothetical protein
MPANAKCDLTRGKAVFPESALGRQIVIQRSHLTGFRHHAAPTLWQGLPGDGLLTLMREAENPYDPDAVALYWRGCKLGYLPRGENFVVARLLDGRRNLSARIERLQPGAHRNRRVRVAVILH